jgi:hypothetical protein
LIYEKAKIPTKKVQDGWRHDKKVNAEAKKAADLANSLNEIVSPLAEIQDIRLNIIQSLNNGYPLEDTEIHVLNGRKVLFSQRLKDKREPQSARKLKNVFQTAVDTVVLGENPKR